MAFRALFAVFLFGSTVFFARLKDFAPTAEPVLLLFAVASGIIVLSIFYAFLFPFIHTRKIAFSYFQLITDTVSVTLIIYITGCFSSMFSFLYLIVIISACFLLFRKGGMIIAALCSIQYGLMVDLEYYGILHPFEIPEIFGVTAYSEPQILYKMTITILACFAVAFLTGLLVEQERQAQKEVEAMKKHVRRVEKMAAIGEMAAGLAHEIKNPLAALSGAVQMLDSNGKSSHVTDNERLQKIIQREIKRMNSLVTNFLLFAKPHKGKVKTIRLDKLVLDVLELFEKGLDTTIQIACLKKITPEIWVKMDPEYLHQILWNFLLNAADAIAATDAASGTITVSAYPAKKHFACIQIEDTGCGISPEEIDSIFNPFFTTKAKGTGLGLSVAHRIMESYDGRIDVESEPGRGTSFTLTLPAINPPPA